MRYDDLHLLQKLHSSPGQNIYSQPVQPPCHYQIAFQALLRPPFKITFSLIFVNALCTYFVPSNCNHKSLLVIRRFTLGDVKSWRQRRYSFWPSVNVYLDPAASHASLEPVFATMRSTFFPSSPTFPRRYPSEFFSMWDHG